MKKEGDDEREEGRKGKIKEKNSAHLRGFLSQHNY